MTSKEKDLIYNAILGAYGDNCMGGKYYKAYSLGVNNAYDRVVEVIRAMPPTEKKGHWIEVLEWRTEFSSAWHYECSECRARSYKGYKPLERYCPKCGAEMSGGGEDENNFGR